MAGTSNTTTDHDEIKKWVEARQGKPATVQRTESGDEPGVLRIDFPGYSGAGSLVEISWEDFFQKFDEKNLAFLYQDTTSSGEQSRFFKFVSRETVEHRADADTDHKKETSHASHSSTKTEHKAESKAHRDDEKSHASGHKTESKNSKDSKDSKSSKSEHKTDDKEHKAASKSHKS